MEKTKGSWERWATLVAVVSSAAAIVFAAVNAWQAHRQLGLAVDQSRADQVSSFAGLSSSCTTGHEDAPRPLPADTLDLWENLCGARQLATEIIINDLLVTDREEQPLVNRTAARQLSIDLEDALVREVLAVARTVRQADQEGLLSTEDVCRARHMLASVYLIQHAQADWGMEHELLNAFRQEMEAQVVNHRRDVENAESPLEKAHGERFLELAELLEDFGRSCERTGAD